jgi:hypothetical protein
MTMLRAVAASALVAAGCVLPAQAAAPGLTLATPTVAGHWKEGWLLGGALRLSGEVSDASQLTAVLRPRSGPRRVTARDDFSVAQAGPFSRTIKLPARPLPGRYDLKVSGTSGATDVSKTVQVSVPAPPEGVVTQAVVSLRQGGPSVPTTPSGGDNVPVVKGAPKQLWVRFQFLYPPDAKQVQVVWNLKWRHKVGVVAHVFKTTIDTYVSTATPLPSGTWNVVLRVNGRIAKQRSVHLLG